MSASSSIAPASTSTRGLLFNPKQWTEIDFSLRADLDAETLAAQTEANNIFWMVKNGGKLTPALRARAIELDAALATFGHEEGALASASRRDVVTSLHHEALTERLARLQAANQTPCDAPAASWYSAHGWLVVSRFSRHAL